MRLPATARRVLRPPTLVAALLLAALLVALTAVAALAQAAPGAGRAPTGRYAEPPTYLLLRLGGDRATFHYTPGTLDRSANLQSRLEILSRGLEKWINQPVTMKVFVLTREEWEKARIDVEYGLPVRLEGGAIAVPARGDARTVALWRRLLGGRLPNVAGTPMMGTVEELASLVSADLLAQLMAAGSVLDQTPLVGLEPWWRAVMAHLAVVTGIERLNLDRAEDIAAVYRQLGSVHQGPPLAVRDFGPDLRLGEWLWYQSRFHLGARALYEKEGKDTLRKMLELEKKGKLELTFLRRKHKAFAAWLDGSFSVISRRP